MQLAIRFLPVVVLLMLVPNVIGISTPKPSIGKPDVSHFETLYWFSFGDSYTDTSFNAFRTLPSVGNPLGNPPYPGFTATGGANWVDYLTTTYNKTLVLTYNLAKGGATINSSLVAPNGKVTLEDEVNTFLNKFAQSTPSANWERWNTLFSIWIGINDIGNSFNNNGSRDAQAGARIFFFINVPPVNRSPLMLAKPVQEQKKEKVVIERFNNKLNTRINWFKYNYTDVSVWKWDSYAVFTSILDDPTSYGFQDATSYGNNPLYFWGNGYHPGAAAHKIFAKNIADTLYDFSW